MIPSISYFSNDHVILFQINLTYLAMRILNHFVINVLYGQHSEDGNLIVEKGTILQINFKFVIFY